MTADDIATAIVAASREMNADPIKVAMAVQSDGARNLEIARARQYAAFALAKVFPNVTAKSIGIVVGFGSPVAFVSSLRASVEHGRLAWWSPQVAQRVEAAVRAARLPTSAPEPEAAPARPSADPRPARARKVDVPRFLLSRTCGRASMPLVDDPRPAAPPRPAASPGKRALVDMLRAAVENTASMTPKG